MLLPKDFLYICQQRRYVCFMAQVISTQNVHIAQSPAPLWQRGVAVFIDLCIAFGYYYGASLLFLIYSPSVHLWLLLLLLIPLFLPMIEETLFDGRTVGKMCMGLRVVNLDGSAPGVWAFVLRNVLLWVDVFFSLGTGIVLMLGTRLHQRWGDLAAGTFVVLANAHTSWITPLSTFDIHPDFRPRFPAIRKLSARRAALVSEAVNTYGRFPKRVELSQLADQIESLIGNRLPGEPPINYLYAVLYEYRHIV